MSGISVKIGDIVTFQADAIVNAANKTLLGGAGVDGAIHRVAGPELLEECRQLGGCETGEAKITKGYNLPAKYVIHTVGPVYKRDKEPEKLLENCYRNSLDLAMANDLHSIVFPAISTGVYGYPMKEAAGIARKTAEDWIQAHPDYDMDVTFCCFDRDTSDIYLGIKRNPEWEAVDEEEENRKIAQLQQWLDESRFTLVVTGAGVSIASGIPSFHDGSMDMRKGFQFASQLVLRTRPQHYYKICRNLFVDAIFENGPNIIHKKLSELEREGKVHGIITTNVDNLHTIAGSKNVAEIQGSFGVNTCLDCGKRTYDVNVWNQGAAPRCECGGLLSCYPVYAKIGLLDEAVVKAQDWARQADLVILAGTTGNYGDVYLPYIKDSARFVQINPKSTYFDSRSDLNIRKTCEEVFSVLK